MGGSTAMEEAFLQAGLITESKLKQSVSQREAVERIKAQKKDKSCSTKN
jgi:hypothetical protein